MSRRVVHWYRATSFNEPVAPWRDSLREVRRDLIQRQLGSYDEYGCFFVTVPGGMQRRSDWVTFEDLPAAIQARRATQLTRPTIVKTSSPPRRISR